MTYQEMQNKVNATAEEYKKVYQEYIIAKHNRSYAEEQEKSLEAKLNNMRGAYAGYVEAMKDFAPTVEVVAQELQVPGQKEESQAKPEQSPEPASEPAAVQT